jgi:hypothetical protein
MRNIVGTYYNIDKDGGSGGDILAFEAAETYMGRVDRQLDDAIVTGSSGGECTIHVNQNGHEFLDLGQSQSSLVEIAYNDTQPEACAFATNCKYIGIALSGNDVTHFELTLVKIAGVTLQQADWFDTIEPTGDPGQSNQYGIEIRVRPLGQNLGETDLVASLTVTGWSGNGNNHYTDTVYITHKYNPS